MVVAKCSRAQSLFLLLPVVDFWGGADPRTTLRASLSFTFLQTLSDLITPLKGHSLSPAAVHRRGQRPPKGSGTDNTAEAT